MRFSVITPSFNCRDYIMRNITSVRQQGLSPEEIEHWIIDGGSTDGTVELLKQQQDIRWISEPDRGLSDAVNKGIKLAHGDWIIWLNADDFLAPNACAVFRQFLDRFPEIKIFSGHQTYLRYDGTIERISEAWDYNLNELLGIRTGMNQASTWIHRDVFERVGVLDISNRYAMDYEWLVRAMHHFQCVPIPHVLSFYQRRKGSITDVNMVKQFQEFLRIRRKYGRSYLAWPEFYFRFYVYTEPLRRIRWVRKQVRKVKRVFGCEPLHPY